jgi:hypothetical protein
VKDDADDILHEVSIEAETWDRAVDYTLGSFQGQKVTDQELLARVYTLGMVLKYGELAFADRNAPAKKVLH